MVTSVLRARWSLVAGGDRLTWRPRPASFRPKVGH